LDQHHCAGCVKDETKSLRLLQFDNGLPCLETEIFAAMLFIPVVAQLSSQFPGKQVGVSLFNFNLLIFSILSSHLELHRP